LPSYGIALNLMILMIMDVTLVPALWVQQKACLLAGLALKFRWRKWYAKSNNLSEKDVFGERPNIVISTCFQAAWEKLIKYMDIDAKFIQPSYKDFKINTDEISSAIDDHTIGVVAIMGNHYGGQYDPVWEINDVVEKVNKDRGFQGRNSY
jgi:glutamate decarboxylase